MQLELDTVLEPVLSWLGSSLISASFYRGQKTQLSKKKEKEGKLAWAHCEVDDDNRRASDPYQWVVLAYNDH
jgi:hypothetical protein